MSMINPYFELFFAHQAESLAFQSNQKVILTKGGNNHEITQAPLSHEQMHQIVQEVAPSFIERLTPGQAISVEYQTAQGEVHLQVRVEDSGELYVIFTPTPVEPEVSAGTVQKAINTSKELVVPPYPTESELDTYRSDLREPVLGDCPLDPYFEVLIESGGSDLYICSGKKAIMRKDGTLVPLEGSPHFSELDAETLLFGITPVSERKIFRETNDVDFSYEIPGLARFRANIFRDRNGIGGIFRQIPSKILSAEQLNLPEAVLKLCTLAKGLVLVTGPTGSGKSTTLAAMIDHINQTRTDHIITIEDPIEFVHQDKSCVINQREIKNHTKGFKPALRAALREDPDIVLVGEMRDLETIEIAIETAETGHLVFGTLHTNTAHSTVDRIIDQFPADRQEQIRTMLSESLKGVVSQTLCKKEGGGRVAALEILIGTNAMANLIREGKTFQLPSMMQTGKNVGMQTLNDALLALVVDKKISPEEGYFRSLEKSEFDKALKAKNIKRQE